MLKYVNALKKSNGTAYPFRWSYDIYKKKISKNEEWEQENENAQFQKSLEAGESFARKISSRTTSINKEINKIWHEQM